MLTIPWLVTSTMRDLMRYPRAYPQQQQQQSSQQQQPEQRLQQQQQPATASAIPVPQNNTTPLRPKPQPSPLRQDQTSLQTTQQQQHQHDTATTASGVGRLVASAETPQQAAIPPGKSVSGVPVTLPKPGQGQGEGQPQPINSPKIARAYIEPSNAKQLQMSQKQPAAPSLQTSSKSVVLTPSVSENRMGEEWAKKTVEKFAFDFDKADKDKSGTLSVCEVIDVLRSIGFKGSNEEAKFIFAHLDKNKDDKITRDEFKCVLCKLPKMSMKEFVLRKTFQQMDKDSSGYLTRTEVSAALQADSGLDISPKIISDILIYLCSEDDDQKVAYDEFLQVLGFEESASILNKTFRLLDKDNSGFLTLNEMNSAIESEGELQKLRPRLHELLKYHAKDSDKKISYHEFVESWLSKREEAKKA